MKFKIGIKGIIYIMHQDMFLYCISRGHTYDTLIILAPDFHVFGSIVLPGKVKHPLLFGKQLLYIKNECLYEFCMCTSKETLLYDAKCAIEFFTKNHKNEFIICMETKIMIGSLEDQCFTLRTSLPSIGCIFMLSLTFGCDFRQSMCDLNDCHVQTYFKDQLNDDCSSLCDILVEFASIIHLNECVHSEVLKYLTHQNKLTIKTFRDLYSCIYMGNCIQSIFDHPHNMFDKHSNYQHILKDMNHIVSTDDFEGKLTLDESPIMVKLKSFLFDKGVNIHPFYVMSGSFHFIPPNHGKGWHHNIESVPNSVCDVIYFVATDVLTYGGSFFLYRHPNSKAIHAVPDIHGTMKQFFLKQDKSNPLWHAIASHSATRVSLGFSKRVDMQEHDLHRPS